MGLRAGLPYVLMGIAAHCARPAGVVCGNSAHAEVAAWRRCYHALGGVLPRKTPQFKIRMDADFEPLTQFVEIAMLPTGLPEKPKNLLTKGAKPC